MNFQQMNQVQIAKIEHTPEFICSMYRLGYISQEEFSKYMLSEDRYIPKINMKQDMPELTESKPQHTMYSLVETEYSKEVRDYIESHADMQQFNGFRMYMVNNVKYVVFDGKS